MDSYHDPRKLNASCLEASRLPTIYLRDLAVSYTDPEMIFESDGSRLLKSENQGLDWEFVGHDNNLHSDNCLVSPRNPIWVRVKGNSFALSVDSGESWRFSKRFSVDYDVSVDYNVCPVMDPDWMFYLFFLSQVDGIWICVEDMPTRIMMAESNYNSDSSTLKFNAWVTDEKGAEDVVSIELLYEGSGTGLQLFDDGIHGDGNAQDCLFSLEIPV